MKPQALTAILILLTSAATTTLHAKEWIRFRGPNGTGLAPGEFLTEWDTTQLAWTAQLPGKGHSSPVIWGNRLFLTSGDEDTGARYAICIDTETGSILWQKEFPSSQSRINALNSFGSSTPAVDQDRVYIAWAGSEEHVLLALDHEGNLAWRREFGPYKSSHGHGSSPLVYKDTVILVNDQIGESFILAVDAETGRDRWKTPRKGGAAAYATPCVIQPGDGPEQLVFCSESDGMTAMEPSSGKILWQVADAFTARVCSSPLYAAGLVIQSCGEGGGGKRMVAVRPPKDEAGRPEIAWELNAGPPYVPMPVAVGDRLFCVHDNGTILCLNTETGDLVWKEKLRSAKFFGSPIHAGGFIYCITTKGDVIVIRAADEFELAGRIPLEQESNSTPAVANGKMFLRTTSKLLCLPVKAME
jgi:outer membrane protein assembly factor BamB